MNDNRGISETVYSSIYDNPDETISRSNTVASTTPFSPSRTEVTVNPDKKENSGSKRLTERYICIRIIILIFAFVVLAGTITAVINGLVIHSQPLNTIQDSKMQRIQDNVKNISGSFQNFKNRMFCYDGVIVNRTCYKLPFRVGIGMNHNEAKGLCIFRGGFLAELPTKETYEAVYEYVKKSWSLDLDHKSRNFVNVWLGSLYKNGKVILQNENIGFTHWHIGNPLNKNEMNRVVLAVATKPNRNPSVTGMFNDYPSVSCVPLCQFILPYM